MHYLVPRMKLIPQDKTMSCWYASGQMLIEWRNRQALNCHINHPDPGLVKKWSKLYDQNNGITNAKIREFARDLGLEMVPPVSPSIEALKGWLEDYGPLWVNGVAHITVIAGIRDTGGSVEVLVYDPAMPHKKNGEWRDLQTWYVLDTHSGRDTSNAVETVFLHLPTNWN